VGGGRGRKGGGRGKRWGVERERRWEEGGGGGAGEGGVMREGGWAGPETPRREHMPLSPRAAPSQPLPLRAALTTPAAAAAGATLAAPAAAGASAGRGRASAGRGRGLQASQGPQAPVPPDANQDHVSEEAGAPRGRSVRRFINLFALADEIFIGIATRGPRIRAAGVHRHVHERMMFREELPEEAVNGLSRKPIVGHQGLLYVLCQTGRGRSRQISPRCFHDSLCRQKLVEQAEAHLSV
jgi:hypothetical protein